MIKIVTRSEEFFQGFSCYLIRIIQLTNHLDTYNQICRKNSLKHSQGTNFGSIEIFERTPLLETKVETPHKDFFIERRDYCAPQKVMSEGNDKDMELSFFFHFGNRRHL